MVELVDSDVKPYLRRFLPVKGQKCKVREKPGILRSISLREFDKGQKFWIHDARSVTEGKGQVALRDGEYPGQIVLPESMCCLVLVACALWSHVGESYNLARMLDIKPPITDYAFTITCDDTTKYCTEHGLWAHINDKDKRMNFCNKFFAPADVGVGIVATTGATAACISTPKTFNLRGAQ
jgi:hypothetical protein